MKAEKHMSIYMLSFKHIDGSVANYIKISWQLIPAHCDKSSAK